MKNNIGMWILAMGLLGGTFLVASASESGHSGEELWSAHCGRCHAPRMAEERSDEQWDVIMMHMQVRAGLTKSEAKAIAAYLKELNDQN